MTYNVFSGTLNPA